MTAPITLDTRLLRLRPTTVDDGAFIRRLMNTPKFKKHIGDRKIRSVDDAKAYIKRSMLPQLERYGYSNFTVIRKADNTKLGTCGLYVREGVEGVDLGFAFLPLYEHKGYAFESAERLKNAAFEEFGITELNAYSAKNNRSSHVLLEKLGFTAIGTIRLPDDDKELSHYRISRPD